MISSFSFYHYTGFDMKSQPMSEEQAEVAKIYVLGYEEFQFFKNNLSLLESYGFLKNNHTATRFHEAMVPKCLLVAAQDLSEGLLISQEYVAEIDDMELVDLDHVPEEQVELLLHMKTPAPIPIPAGEERKAQFISYEDTPDSQAPGRTDEFIISKVIELGEADFQYYRDHMYEGHIYGFEQKNQWHMDFYDTNYICLLVTTSIRKEGVLVCDGYQAYLPDCSGYNVKGLECERWLLGLKDPQYEPGNHSEKRKGGESR